MSKINEINKIFKPLESEIGKVSRYKYSAVYDNDFFKEYQKLLEAGRLEKAIQLWNGVTPKSMMNLWGKTVQEVMLWSTKELRNTGSINFVTAKVSITSRQVQNILMEDARSFTNNILAKHYFDIYKVDNSELKKKIVNASIAQFEKHITGAMANTPAHILNDIREFQKELHLHHQAISNMDDLSPYIDKVEADFKRRMKSKFRSFYQAMEDGKVLKSRWYGKNLDKVKAYGLEEYSELMARPTILNIDRASGMAFSYSRGHRVTEYKLVDNRKLITNEEREICKSIIKNKTHGKALLALDEETALILGIKTVGQAQSEGAMTIHCRHSVRPVSDEFNNTIEKIIFLKQQFVEAG